MADNQTETRANEALRRENHAVRETYELAVSRGRNPCSKSGDATRTLLQAIDKDTAGRDGFLSAPSLNHVCKYGSRYG
jgi:hypothetical protein